MRRPNAEQLKQLMLIRQYPKVLEYLQELEEDYISTLISAVEEAEVRKLQGAVSTVRRLRQLITTEQR